MIIGSKEVARQENEIDELYEKVLKDQAQKAK